MHNQRKETTNLKTKNNQNGQKTELCGGSTTKEVKKKHSSRLVGGVEMGSQGRKDMWRGGGWWLAAGAGMAVAGGPGGPTFVCR